MSMTMIMGYKLFEEKTLRVMLSRFLIFRQNYEKKTATQIKRIWHAQHRAFKKETIQLEMKQNAKH